MRSCNYFATGKWGQSREYDLCVNSRINAKAAGKHDEKPKPKRAGLMFGA